jgi:hypothetical protein
VDAFTASKQPFLDSLRAEIGDAKEVVRHSSLREILGDDPPPYVIDPNEKTINALIDYSVDKRIAAPRYEIDEVFAS